MKRARSWNLLFAMVAIVAMGGFIFGCNDEETKNVSDSSNPAVTLKGSIAGQVVDVNNQPVSGATVSCTYPGGTATVTTDSAGQYLLQKVPVAGQLNVSDSGSPYLIVVQKEGFETAFTAALLNYAVLESTEQIEVIGGELQVVGDLQVSAVTAVMRRPNAVVKGNVVRYDNAAGIEGALVTITRDAAPDAYSIWWSSTSEWSITNNVDVTDSTGLFELTAVPEGTDAAPVSYVLTISAEGFSTTSGSMVSVGYGDHEYQAGVFYMTPVTPPTDTVAPFVVATNVPPVRISLANLGGPFTFTFNEAMRTDIPQVIVSLVGGAPIPTSLSWSEDSMTVTVALERPLPEGATISIELRYFRDLSNNAYVGTDPTGSPDAFKSLGTSLGATRVALTTQGDPTLMQASNLLQLAAVADENQPIGGKSGNAGQANNLNLFDSAGNAGVGVLGDADGEANVVSLSWDAAVPADGTTGVVRYYKVYAELATGGFASGFPVFVKATPTRLDGNPPTTIDVTLTEVDTAIATYNASNPASDPDLPRVGDENGTATTFFFDDGFSVNMAVTAVNSDGLEGDYTNVVAVHDNVPPTVADRGAGFDTSVPTNWAIYPVNVTALAVTTLGVDYNADDYAAFAALPGDLTIFMSEDLQAGQTVTGELVSLGGGGETLGTCQVTQAEVTPGTPKITCTLNGIAQVQQNDHIILAGVLDEAGNASEAGDSVAHLYDLIPPFIVSGVVQDNGTDPDQIVLTMSEPVTTASAQTLANYAGVTLAGSTAVLGDDGVTVTITAAADRAFANVRPGFGDGTSGPALDIAATNLINIKGTTPGTTGVRDLRLNVQPLIDLNSDGVDDVPFNFQLVDEIAPRILAAATAAGAINTAAAVDDDGVLAVGDTSDTYALILVFGEPVVWDVNADGALDAADMDALGIALTATPALRYSAPVNAAAPAANILAFGLAVATPPVGSLDSFTVTCADIAGNAVNPDFDTVVLRGATEGYLIQ